MLVKVNQFVGLMPNVRQVIPVSLNWLGSVDFMTGSMCRGGDSISFVCLSETGFGKYDFMTDQYVG